MLLILRAIKIGVRDIILEGNLSYVMGRLRSKDEDNSWLGAIVETTTIRISISHDIKIIGKNIVFYKIF